jgi:YfiH family protein
MNQKNCRLEPDGRLTFPGFSTSSLFHAVFNRQEGVSPTPWHSRNVSFGIGDNPKNVLINRERIKKSLAAERLVSANQVHGSKVHVIHGFPSKDLEIEGYDALITNVSGVGLMIQQADCQAVLLFDPENKVTAIAHVGWRGSVAGIISETISTMGTVFASEPADLQAAISPSLGPCCAEFVNFHTELPPSLHGYQVRQNYFDFWAISRDQLCSAGVRPENITVAEVCTYCSQDYFSYRRDKKTGRGGSVIGLRKAEG